MLKPTNMTEMIGQFYHGVIVQAENDADEKEDIRQGINNVKGVKLI